MKKRLSVVISTVFGVGYFPFAPGTVGSLAAFACYFLMPDKWLISSIQHFLILIYSLMASILAAFICDEAETVLGHDDKKIVIDEFIGYFFAVLFFGKSLLIGILAFVFFRIFDIFKPFPINNLQKLKGGWGIMVDDLAAGLFANLAIRLTFAFFENL